MNTSCSRRVFVKSLLAATAVPAIAGAAPAAPPGSAPLPPDAQGLTTYQIGPHVWVRWNNRLLTAYRAHHSQKYPYVYPVAGPVTGLSLTAETGLPWPHHRSLFFGCDRLNGGNYWQNEFESGQILSSGPSVGKPAKQAVEILDACIWQKPGGPVVMKDQRRITVNVAHDRLWFLDWDIQWTAVQDVTVQKNNHSLFALRAALDLTPWGGGVLLNANGQSGEKATFGKPSQWCGFHGQRERIAGELVEGIAILDHPKNPWSPCPWFTRDYGFISPTPFNYIEKPWELPAGQSVTLRYRVVMHAGTPREAGLDAIHAEWTA